jgi:hypothetical protein
MIIVVVFLCSSFGVGGSFVTCIIIVLDAFFLKEMKLLFGMIVILLSFWTSNFFLAIVAHKFC